MEHISNSTSSLIWKHNSGNSSINIASDCVTVNNYVYTNGYFTNKLIIQDMELVNTIPNTSAIYLLKYNLDGKLLSTYIVGHYSGINENIVSIPLDVDIDGNIYMNIVFTHITFTMNNGDVYYSSNGSSLYVKLSNNCCIRYVKQIKGQNVGRYIGSNSIKVDKFNNLYITSNNIVEVVYGLHIITPSTSGLVKGHYAKLDNTGEWVWAKDIFYDTTYSISKVTLIDTSIYIYGDFKGNIQASTDYMSSVNSTNTIFVGEIDSDGKWIWAKSISGIPICIQENNCTSTNVILDNYSYSSDISVDSNKNIYITGIFKGKYILESNYNETKLSNISNSKTCNMMQSFERSIFVIKLNESGPVWVKTILGKMLEYPNIVTDSDGNSYITIFFRDFIVLTFNSIHSVGKKLQGSGVTDIMTLKITHTGNWVRNALIPCSVLSTGHNISVNKSILNSLDRNDKSSEVDSYIVGMNKPASDIINLYVAKFTSSGRYRYKHKYDSSAF